MGLASTISSLFRTTEESASAPPAPVSVDRSDYRDFGWAGPSESVLLFQQIDRGLRRPAGRAVAPIELLAEPAAVPLFLVSHLPDDARPGKITVVFQVIADYLIAHGLAEDATWVYENFCSCGAADG